MWLCYGMSAFYMILRSIPIGKIGHIQMDLNLLKTWTSFACSKSDWFVHDSFIPWLLVFFVFSIFFWGINWTNVKIRKGQNFIGNITSFANSCNHIYIKINKNKMFTINKQNVSFEFLSVPTWFWWYIKRIKAVKNNRNQILIVN